MIPENRKIPAEQLKGIEAVIDTRVLPANPDQIINTGDGFATIASVYRILPTVNPVLDFRTSGMSGSPVLPVYSELTINTTDAKEFNTHHVKASYTSNPAWLTTYASLIEFVDVSTLLLGYENLNYLTFQVRYNLVGVLKVYLTIVHAANANLDPNPPQVVTQTAGFNLLFDINRNYGVETDPVYVSMTGDIAGGVDGRVATMSHSSPYVPSFLVDVLVEPWGTKPAWLTITGDAYLIGVKNLNNLTFTYNAGAVTVVNSAVVDGNLDVDKPVFEILTNLQFNENHADLAINNILDNDTDWQDYDFAESEILPALDASYIDLGGGNYSLRTSTNGATGGIPVIEVGTSFNRMIAPKKLTFLFRFRRINADANTAFWIASFSSNISEDGFRLELRTDENRLKLRTPNINSAGTNQSIVFEQNEWIFCALTISEPDNRIRQFAEALDYATPIVFGQKGSNPLDANVVLTSPSTVMRLNSSLSSTSSNRRNDVELDYFQIVADELQLAQIEEIKNNPSNVKSILKTHYGY